MLTYKKIDRKHVTEKMFKQIMEVENSTGSGYDEDVMREIWIERDNNDNFACFDGDKIVAHISYNPKSKRRNGSIFMVNLTVLPEYRRQGIASALTSHLAIEILNRGKVPFYCAAWCNVRSVRNAIKSGFRPAWVEMTAKPVEMVDEMNK
jgi:predicted GNAT family acetyltransferase